MWSEENRVNMTWGERGLTWNVRNTAQAVSEQGSIGKKCVVRDELGVSEDGPCVRREESEDCQNSQLKYQYVNEQDFM